jgi:protease I
VAAVCHAPWLLIDAGLVSGRKVTSWPSVRTDLKNAGGTVVDESAVTDRGIITSRKPEDLHDFVAAIASQLAQGA